MDKNFEYYMEMAKANPEKKESDDIKLKESFILKQIKKADDALLKELAHYTLGDLGDYSEEDDELDFDKLYDDLVVAIKQASSKTINKIYDILK